MAQRSTHIHVEGHASPHVLGRRLRSRGFKYRRKVRHGGRWLIAIDIWKSITTLDDDEMTSRIESWQLKLINAAGRACIQLFYGQQQLVAVCIYGFQLSIVGEVGEGFVRFSTKWMPVTIQFQLRERGV
jgi:hypothetical protein